MQENRCPWCRAFENISRKLQNPQYTAFCITRDSSAYDLTLPDRNGQNVSLLLLTEDEAAKQIAQDRQMVQVNLEIVLCPDAKKCGGFQGKVAVRKYAVFINCSSAVS